MFFMNGQQIYDNFQDGDGPEGLSGGAAIVNEIAAGYEARAQQIRALTTRMETAWEGDASGAARRGAGPMSSEHELSGPSLMTTQDLTNRQAESYSSAKNAVVPVPPEPVLLDPMQVMMSDGLTPYEDQLDEHNAAARNNLDVMSRYESASFGNLDGLPSSYGTFVDGTTEDPSGLSVSTGGGPGISSGVIDSGDYTTSDDGDGSDSLGPGPGGDTGGAVSSGHAPSPTGAGPGAVSPSDSGVTTPGGLTPGVTPPGTPVIGGPDTGVGTGRPPGGGVVPGVGVVAGPGFGVGSGAGPGGGAGGPRGGGVAGPRGGVLGGPGVEPTGSTRPGAAGAVTGAGGRGGAGMSGMPMGGAGRGRDGEDTERTRPPYLEGGDPEELFDTDQLTAPPTIGEDDDH
jgi:hypothetical protein